MAGERKFVDTNVKRALLREYLKEQIKRAGYGGADIQRTPMGTRVTLITERPGLVIGRKGGSIKALTDAIEFDFGFDKPQVEVVEVENANLSAQIMAEKLASALERGWHFRRAGHSTVRRIMENGAKGCQVIISGKLTGQRHRTEKFKEGHIKFCGEPKLQWMEEGYTPAKLKAGVIGVKVQIMHPKARLPDEVNIKDEKEVAKIPDADKPEEKKPAKVEKPSEEPKTEEPSEKVEEKKAPAKKKVEKPEPPAVKEPKAAEPAPEKKAEKPPEKPPEEPKEAPAEKKEEGTVDGTA
ncbi:MAG: 30S ribosomal protein S3 [Thermoplasmata archaeon]|nr:30S ribosomal protein S3 [Thermoplasmata archaeon]